jgi:hypothetical protein
LREAGDEATPQGIREGSKGAVEAVLLAGRGVDGNGLFHGFLPGLEGQ